MAPDVLNPWLLLVHQIPLQPNYLRVKIWRRLQQVGAVAIKQSVYAMPLSDQSREDLSWILKEIVEGGGDGSLLEARFLEGLTDDQVVALFQSARKKDYEKLIQEVSHLLAEWSSGETDAHDPAVKGPAQVAKLRRRLDEIFAIDFFEPPERGTAEILLKDLSARVSGEAPAATAHKEVFGELKGRTWVTRKGPFVDRIACGWLIRRFVDSKAVFKFVGEPRYIPLPGELRFDMFEGEFTHEGDQCTFEAMVKRLLLQERALRPIGEIVHDIDLKDDKYGRNETQGFHALLSGLVSGQGDDDQRMEEGIRLVENLYTYFERNKVGKKHV
jgi:hypothetical protein